MPGPMPSRDCWQSKSVFCLLVVLLSCNTGVHAQSFYQHPWCEPQSLNCPTTYQAVTNLSCGWCRSWTFSTDVANNRLRMIGLDGGAVAGDGNSSHNYLIETSLDNGFDLSNGNAWNLSLLPSAVPVLKGGAFWGSPSNDTLYAYGGSAPSNNVPSGSALPTFNTSSQQWSNVSSIFQAGRLTNGVSVTSSDNSKAWYIGGFASNYTSQGQYQDGLHHYPSQVIQFDLSSGSGTPVSAPFLPVQFGGAAFLPVGGGALVYFGGEVPPSSAISSDTRLTANLWDHVWIYDIGANKWYKQNTSGNAAPRTEFCTSTIYDDASRSWQIWAFGGADYDSSVVTSTVSVLSIPSFQWFNASSGASRMSTSCQRIGSQTFVLGGRNADEATGGTDYSAVGYVYDLNRQATASTYQPALTSYTAPSSIRAAISTASTPASWDPAVRALFASSSASSPQTTSGSSSGASSNSEGGLSGGAIAGIVIGVVAGLAAVIGLVVFILPRCFPSSQQGAADEPYTHSKAELDAAESQPLSTERPVEVSGDGVRYEMPDGPKAHELDPKQVMQKRKTERYEMP